MDDKQWDIIRPMIARMRASVMAVAFGLFAGISLFAATLWLVIRGGTVMRSGREIIGPHLGLLENFYPGYAVTYWGAFVGFAYAAATGAVLGYVVAWVYNTVALRGAKGAATHPKD